MANRPTAREARFTKRNARTLELHEQAAKTLPGGNTRTQLHTTPFPNYMKSGCGHQVTSEDGHTQVLTAMSLIDSVWALIDPSTQIYRFRWGRDG